MFNKTLLFIVIFVALAVTGISAMPMSDGFTHNLPDGGCVSSVAKILPCSKDGFQADILIGLFLLLAISLFLLFANSPALTAFLRARGRIFEYHSFSIKSKPIAGRLFLRLFNCKNGINFENRRRGRRPRK